jgi:hypothetical protein
MESASPGYGPRITAIRDIAGRVLIRTLACDDSQHAIFAPYRRGDDGNVGTYRFTVFFPDDSGTRIVPALRATYGAPVTTVRSDVYFSKGDPFVGSAWARPGVPVIKPVPALSDFDGDEDVWRAAWANLGVKHRHVERMGRRAPSFTPHVRSIACYAIHRTDDAQLVVAIESTRKDAFDDRWVYPLATGKKTGKFGLVLSRLSSLTNVLEESVSRTSTLGAPVAGDSGRSFRAPTKPAHGGDARRSPGSEPPPPRSMDSEIPRDDWHRPSRVTVAPQAPPSPVAVFISHAHEDAELAMNLVAWLKECVKLPDDALRCTSLDGYGLELGAQVRARLQDEIRSAKVVIGLLTRAGAKSEWVPIELGAAWGSGCRVCCLLGPGLSVDRVPAPLADLHTKSLLEQDCLAKLVDVICNECHYPKRSDSQRDSAMRSFHQYQQQLSTDKRRDSVRNRRSARKGR